MPAGTPRVRRIVDRIPFLDKELFALHALVPMGGTVVDVGAAGGAHTFLAARLVGRSGHVLAVEARAGSVRILRAMRRALGAEQVRIVNVALGAAPGELTLRVPLVPTRSHAHGGDDGTLLARLPARTTTVGMTTLDRLVANHGLDRVDLVKVDVEGGECDVLEGGQATIDRHRPTLVLEVVDHYLQREGRSADDLFGWLAALGYQPCVVGDAGLEPVDGHRPDQHNWVFLPG